MTRRDLLLCAAATAAIGHGAAAQGTAGSTTPPGDASRFIERVGQELPALLAGTRTDAERRARLVGFLERVADLDGISQFCLGRWWRLATPDQQREYRGLFAQALAAAVAARVGVYGDGQTQIGFRPEIATPLGTEVRTIVRSAGQSPVEVHWVVDATRQPFRIVDVSAEGISARLTLRSDYGAFLNAHGGDIALFLQTLRRNLS